MVMELLDGHTVHHRLKQSGKMSPKVACDVMWQVADAVRFIHSRTILHGDIKTENIFLVRTTLQRRLVKLLDFGLARPDLGRTEGIDGTPEYLSPERISGGPASQASDIYALGIVFFELLTGQLPFRADSMPTLMLRIAQDPHPRIRLMRPDLPAGFDGFFDRALAKNPADRHENGAVFAQALRDLRAACRA
jgi:serine/threonine-protein kinase